MMMTMILLKNRVTFTCNLLTFITSWIPYSRCHTQSYSFGIGSFHPLSVLRSLSLIFIAIYNFSVAFSISHPTSLQSKFVFCSLQLLIAMASSTTNLLSLLVLLVSSLVIASAGNFYQEFDVTWGDGRGQILNNGDLLTLSLDKASGSGFQSKNEYLYGKIDMQIRLVPGNSAGTVTAYYLRSEGSTWDEIDFEFLGNLSGDPYIVHTNVFSQGKGNREQQFHLWFDPTADFHSYSILWNPQRIVFYVDGTPLREFKNKEAIGVAFPKNQPMRLKSSLWNADDWATRGGLVKTDWSQAPFTASYRNFNANACSWSSGKSSCSSSGSQATSSNNNNSWFSEELDSHSQERLSWVQKNYMVYNYCTDTKRFSQGLPPECNAAA